MRMSQLSVAILRSGCPQQCPDEADPAQQVENGASAKERQAQPHTLESDCSAVARETIRPGVKRGLESKDGNDSQSCKREQSSHGFGNTAERGAPVSATDVLQSDPYCARQRQAEQVVADEQKIQPNSLGGEVKSGKKRESADGG